MNVVGISGSPRKNGNSEILLDRALAPFRARRWNVTILKLSALSVAPCDGCDTCRASGVCRIDDDMQSFYDAFASCDALLVSSPAYWRNVSGQLKCVMDRAYALGEKRPLAGKPGGAIAVGAGSSGGQAIALTVIYNFMFSSGMICVPGELNGVTAVADAPGDVLKDGRKLAQAETLGLNVLEIAEKISGGAGKPSG